MSFECGRLPSAGGKTIFWRAWTPEGAPRAVLQIAHGLGEHSGRYEELACWLTARGFAVVASDHMGHGHSDGAPGCFSGGWEVAEEDLRRVARRCLRRWPGVPLFLLGHSMGSFLVRTLLIVCPDLPLRGALLSGTAQYPRHGTAALGTVLAAEAALRGERQPSAAAALTERLFNLPFGPAASPWAWVSRDAAQRRAMALDPLCDTRPALGLQRDMLWGIAFNERPENLARMRRTLPVLFFSGDQDPVGLMGRGVRAAAESFRRAGMERVELRLYPGARHETLHELCRRQVFADLIGWMEALL